MVQELQTVDHVEAGNENRLSQYTNWVDFTAFIDAFLEEINELEVDIQDFKEDLYLATALGVNLTRWGNILQARTRLANDDAYRSFLYALVGAYNSEGRPEDIRSIVQLVLQATRVFIVDQGGAVFNFVVFNPTQLAGVPLLGDVVRLAKPVGTEFEGYVIADLYTEPTFSFINDSRENSQGFAIAVPPPVPDTFWDNYVYAAQGSITDTRRIYWEISGSQQTINFVTATSDTQWRTDLNTLYNGVVGAIVGWPGKDGEYYHITTLATTGTLIDAGAVGDSYTTKLVLTTSAGITAAILQRKNRPLVASQLDQDKANLEYFDDEGPVTLGRTITDGTLNDDDYGTTSGGRYSVIII